MNMRGAMALLLAATLTLGEAGSFVVKTSGFPFPSFGLSSPITGISLVDNHNGTAALTAPTAGAGPYTLTITASNGIGTTVTQTFKLTIVQSPTFLNAPVAATITVGTAAAFTLTTTASPTPTLTVAGLLPKGLTFTDNHDGTATLHGAAVVGTSRTYSLVVTASNGVLPAALQLFTLVVQ